MSLQRPIIFSRTDFTVITNFYYKSPAHSMGTPSSLWGNFIIESTLLKISTNKSPSPKTNKQKKREWLLVCSLICVSSTSEIISLGSLPSLCKSSPPKYLIWPKPPLSPSPSCQRFDIHSRISFSLILPHFWLVTSSCPIYLLDLSHLYSFLFIPHNSVLVQALIYRERRL